MTCFQLIFSPTGGTERVAKALTETWPKVQTIDLSAQNFTAPAIPFSADDLVLIAMPAFEALHLSRSGPSGGSYRAMVPLLPWQRFTATVPLINIPCPDGRLCPERRVPAHCHSFCHCGTQSAA